MKNLLRFLFLIIFLLFLIFKSCSNPGTPKGKKEYILTVSGEDFHVPRGYIWAYNFIKSGHIFQPNFHVLYPNFEPKTKQNAHVFEALGRGGGREITFLIKESSTSKSIEEIIEMGVGEALAKKEDVAYGLSVYAGRTKGREFLVGTWHNGDPVYFDCSTIGTVPSPSCGTRIMLNEKIMVRVTFSRDLLSEWGTFCTGLLKKVNSFRKNIKSESKNYAK
jgi:hypothetical protein